MIENDAMKEEGIVLFVDFDGTITKQDVCAAMVEAFAGAGWREINKRWERKEISTEQCANMTFNLFQADLSDLKRLLDTMEIDEYFKEFLGLCRERGHRVYVLSDGYDLCIEAVFEKYHINVPYYANRMIYDGSFKIECRGANPNAAFAEPVNQADGRTKGEGNTVVYIGDGTPTPVPPPGPT